MSKAFCKLLIESRALWQEGNCCGFWPLDMVAWCLTRIEPHSQFAGQRLSQPFSRSTLLSHF
jgi:hypothetical protein